MKLIAYTCFVFNTMIALDSKKTSYFETTETTATPLLTLLDYNKYNQTLSFSPLVLG